VNRISLQHSLRLRSHFLLLFLILLNELLLLCDTIFASDEEKDHHDDYKNQKNDAPDDDIIAETSICDPEEEADHEAQAASDDGDHKDGIFDDLFGGQRVIIFRNSLEGWLVGSHDLLVLVLLAQSEL